jgi:hypothetical protein
MAKMDARDRNAFGLIETKLWAPRLRSGLVERPSLIAQLNSGLERGLAL